jgi:4-methylaminobutanoate oxidase (formaldehyde-forming)
LGAIKQTDACLIERNKLTSGLTWHARANRAARSSANITQLLIPLPCTTGWCRDRPGDGWKRNGGLRLACNSERWTEVKRQATTARSFGLEMQLLSAKEAQDLWPLMQVDDVVGAAFLPTDGQASPSDIAAALAKGARRKGVTIREGVAIVGVEVENGAVRAVVTSVGRVACEKLVICAGQWSRAVGRLAGVDVPLTSIRHQYIVTEAVAGVTSGLPTLRDPTG